MALFILFIYISEELIFSSLNFLTKFAWYAELCTSKLNNEFNQWTSQLKMYFNCLNSQLYLFLYVWKHDMCQTFLSLLYLGTETFGFDSVDPISNVLDTVIINFFFFFWGRGACFKRQRVLMNLLEKIEIWKIFKTQTHIPTSIALQVWKIDEQWLYKSKYIIEFLYIYIATFISQRTLWKKTNSNSNCLKP